MPALNDELEAQGYIVGDDVGPEDEVELTALEELYEFAAVLREGDELEKEGKALKDSAREPFLELVSEVVREDVPLVRQVVEVTNEELERYGHDYEKWAGAKYPIWTVEAVEGSAVGAKIALQEDPGFKKFEFEFDGYKFGRTVAMQGKSFDAEGFLEHVTAEKLPAALKKALRETVTTKTVVVYDFDEAKATKLMADKPETVAIFQDFINEGVPQVRLLPIKPVKENEA